MNEPLSLQKQLMVRIVLFVVPFFVIAALFGQWQTALGLLLGGVGALIHLRLLVLDVCKLTDVGNPGAATKQARRGYAKRMALLCLVLAVPIFNPWFNFAATAVGLFSTKVAIYLGEFITYMANKQR